MSLTKYYIRMFILYFLVFLPIGAGVELLMYGGRIEPASVLLIAFLISLVFTFLVPSTEETIFYLDEKQLDEFKEELKKMGYKRMWTKNKKRAYYVKLNRFYFPLLATLYVDKAEYGRIVAKMLETNKELIEKFAGTLP